MNYAKIARSFLPEESWEKDYRLTLNIYEELAILASIAGDVESSEKFFSTLFSSAKSIHDKINSYAALTMCYVKIAKYRSVYEIGKQAMKELGIEMPVDDPKKLQEINLKRTEEILEMTQKKSHIRYSL